MRVLLSAAAALTLVACGGGGPPSPSGLAYSLPTPAQLVYEQGDTMNMDIDAGGQSMQARVTIASTLAASFARAADGLQVTVDVEDYNARMSNPAAGTVRADESGIDGPVVFNLDRRGRGTLVTAPELDETARQFFQPLSMATSLFPRLPGKAVDVGESWMDTVRVEGEQAGGTVKAVSFLTYTMVGDTVVDGHSLVRIDIEGTAESASQGQSGGMDVTQNVSGDVSGYVLWDTQRSVVFEAFSEGDSRGSMEVSAAPFPLGVRIRVQSRMKLKEEM